MKKLLLALAFSFICAISPIQSQTSTVKDALSYSIINFDYYGPFTDGETFGSENGTTGAMLGYHRNLAGNFLNLEVPIKIGTVRLPTVSDELPFNRRHVAAGLDALLQLQYSTGSNPIVPYLSVGAGGLYVVDDDFDFQIPAGVGIDLRLLEGFYLRARSEYRLSFNDDRNSWNHIAGIKMLLGASDKPEKPIEIVPTDTDGDGISDNSDKCPTVPGLAALEGCPDGDGDGVTDADDECPTVAGLSKYSGCPDTDSDGIIDSKDNCPTEAGPANNNGCPFGDSDGDGVTDNVDDCPDTKGLAKYSGCPDTDGDGTIDKNDDCPNIKGLAAYNGCPDTDGDGTIDKNDKCPSEAGPASNKGCPELKEEEKEILTFAAQNIQFNTNSSVIRTESYDILDKVADILNKYEGYRCTISGHTDSQGNSGHNQSLSEKRAKSCYEYLVKKGVSGTRLSYAGYGETQPIADNRNAAGRKMNRRVVFDISL